MLYFNTNKPHSFFLQNTSCIKKLQVISEGAHPLHPPPRSARGEGLASFNNDNSANFRMVKKSTMKPTAMSIFLRIRKKTLS